MRDRRRAWACDCDGESHLHGARTGMELAVIERMRKGIAELVGSEPPTCPWRAFYDPLMGDVMRAMPHFDKGNLAVAIGGDPPEILFEALSVFHTAKETMIAHIEHRRHQDQKRR